METNISQEIIAEAKFFCPYHPTMGNTGLKRMNRWKDMYYNLDDYQRHKIKIQHYENKICDLKRRLNHLELEIPRLQQDIDNSQKALENLFNLQKEQVFVN